MNSSYFMEVAASEFKIQGLEIDYRPGEPSQLLHLKGWLRLNTKVGYVEQSDRAITGHQKLRIAEIFGEEKKDG